MTRALYFACVGFVVLSGCSVQRTICPAYQSAFLFDPAVEKRTFVLYNDNKSQPQEILASNSKTITLPAKDSAWERSVVVRGPALPPVTRVKKGRYLLLPPKTYKKALRALQTVPMKAVYPRKETDSLDIKKALDSAARSVNDTMTATQTKATEPEADSTYVITKAKEKFNVDQDNYMWYFRDILVLPDVRLAMEAGKEASGGATSGGAKQNLFKKFLGLFKKKPKADSLAVAPNDSTGAPVVKKRKGLFGLFGKKSKIPLPVQKPEGIKEEDHGF